ncbi:uncharacterized protein si:ch73-43g23.1 [Clarias gariepinus]|uniref:uncharacterized protein si:ch73-43g23.1 n=1 Tax=Clarias gariepinus TaxID=13013 RepID=UPI00234D00C6|nr:uncharacterized protein si:ch73-43g23.1 [Clarias gariepinus]
MDSWVLEGDSYSFLRSAPRNFNLPHQDGPNRVEIFDITNIQSHRSAISETTCLCDIFGDDSESPSLSSSPASASFLKKDTDEQLPVEDVNDSSGSYHTANGSEHLSDGSEIYEDSKDTKDLVLSETLEANVQASDLPAAHKCDAPAPIRNWQVSDLSQDTNLTQVKNSSDHQLATSTSEFRDTNIRVTGSPQEIFCLELLSENKTITDQSHATSFELRRTNSSEEITTYNPKHITKQGDAFSSEQKKKNSAENIITPDSSLENGIIIEQRGTMTSEVREPDTVQENTHYKQSIFSENQTSSESYPSNLTSEDSTKGNNDQVCLIEEGEKISLPDILSIENSLLVCGIVQSDTSVALTNVSNDGSVFTSLQKAGVSDRSAQDNTHDLTEMSTPLEHEDVPNELPYAGAFLCDNKAGMSDLPDPNGEPVPEYIEDNTEVDVGYMPQDINISSDTNRTLSSFSDPREELVSSVISEVYTPSGLSGDVNFPELPVIIHSPVGFTICPSPEPESNRWSEELAFTSRTPESDYRLTPTDKGSVSSFDSNLCPTPEPRSISSTSDNRQNVIICDPNPAASSLDLRSASCSPEIQITPCSFLSSQNDFSSPDEVLEQPHDLAGIIHAEMSSTLPTKEAGDFSIPIIYNLSSAQDATSSPSTIFPRDTVFPGFVDT